MRTAKSRPWCKNFYVSSGYLSFENKIKTKFNYQVRSTVSTGDLVEGISLLNGLRRFYDKRS